MTGMIAATTDDEDGRRRWPQRAATEKDGDGDDGKGGEGDSDDDGDVGDDDDGGGCGWQCC